MPIVIHRPDLAPKREVFPYDRIVSTIMFVIVGLWIVYDALAILLIGSFEGFVPKGAGLDEDVAKLNRQVALVFAESLAFGAWFVMRGVGIRNSLRYGFWLIFPAGIALVLVNGVPKEEPSLMQSAFALLAMGYCTWRLVGWAGQKPN